MGLTIYHIESATEASAAPNGFFFIFFYLASELEPAQYSLVF
jgi:hypothetical protein